VILEQIEVGYMQNFVYVVGDPTTAEGFVVDPAFEPEKILNVAKKIGIEINKIFLTHHHSDHVNAASLLKAKTGAKVFAHTASEQLLKGIVDVDASVSDGEIIRVGDKENLKVLHTPGHAPGAICLIIGDRWLITGDTLFVGNCGRTDLPGGNSRQLYESLNRLKLLPDELEILPGHNYGPAKSRSLGNEKRLNPMLKASNFDEFDALP